MKEIWHILMFIFRIILSSSTILIFLSILSPCTLSVKFIIINIIHYYSVKFIIIIMNVNFIRKYFKNTSLFRIHKFISSEGNLRPYWPTYLSLFSGSSLSYANLISLSILPPCTLSVKFFLWLFFFLPNILRTLCVIKLWPDLQHWKVN